MLINIVGCGVNVSSATTFKPLIKTFDYYCEYPLNTYNNGTCIT